MPGGAAIVNDEAVVNRTAAALQFVDRSDAISRLVVADAVRRLDSADPVLVFPLRVEWTALVAVMAGLAAGPDRGASVAFATGIAFDLMLQSPFGLSALTYVIVAYLVGSLQDSVLRAAWWIPAATAAIGSAIGVILYGVFGTIVGQDLLHPSLLKIAVPLAPTGLGLRSN